MSVHVVDRTRIVSDRSGHEATSVGQDAWVVSFLPGRTLTAAQALAAIQIADIVADVETLTRPIGLTALEAVGLVVVAPSWNRPSPRRNRAS
ncbi:hypothetical protein HLB23_24500 [Nocardia uniformis]|uniref:Uncharacterized protein n=1 Tax=Nocardia uniformis TaxID=53432 RepID=A0A849C2S2_9NOCA|nr:hypothetical protein [Nocardia uniformis]NNH72982.1 hypothetical protein [Nocardia uniformis]